MQNPVVTFETSAGAIKAELYPEVAPNSRRIQRQWFPE